MQSKQSKHFSFRQTARSLFSIPTDNPALIQGVSVSSEQDDASNDASDVVMSAIKTSLSALQVGSAFATKIPFIAPVAGLLLQALTMRDEVKQCKEQCKIVMRKLARIANVVVNVGKSCEKYSLNERDLPDGLRTILDSLQRELAGVEHVLKKCAKAKGVKGFLLRNDLLTKVKQCDGELSNVLEAVLLELSLDNRFAQIADARETAAYSNPIEQMPSIPQEPNTPQIFFGRDVELTQIVHMVFSGITSRPARIAILGPGGYGKTTLAHAVLTHDRIRKHFGDACHFVPCESTFSSEALLIELGKTLRVLDGPPNAIWSRIRTVLSTRESILCLDNFESPWDQSSDIKHSVEELLSRVTVLPHVTILITMRGAERPARTHWSHPFLDPLDTFGQTAAEQVWQAIAENYDEHAGKLTAAVDYVPLAVDLLAHLSQMTPPILLWEEWNFKRTKVVQMGQVHRLSNLEYSIQLSIDCQRMKGNSSAKSLLGVLSMLPDGLHIKQLERF
ncbi:P-loop containing nucleoside triphosphate hydrolase protein, partial [Lactarius tabidus]